MDTHIQGYWACAVADQVYEDAAESGINERDFDVMIREFLSLGEIDNVAADDRLQRLIGPNYDYYTFRMRFDHPFLYKWRGLVKIFATTKGSVLVLCGLFERSAEAYDSLMIERLAELGTS